MKLWIYNTLLSLKGSVKGVTINVVDYDRCAKLFDTLTSISAIMCLEELCKFLIKILDNKTFSRHAYVPPPPTKIKRMFSCSK